MRLNLCGVHGAWALGIALGALAYYWNTMPERRRDRLAMLRNLLDSYLD